MVMQAAFFKLANIIPYEEAEKYIMPQGHKCYFAVVTGNEVSDDLEPPVAFFEWGLES